MAVLAFCALLDVADAVPPVVPAGLFVAALFLVGEGGGEEGDEPEEECGLHFGGRLEQRKQCV